MSYSSLGQVTSPPDTTVSHGMTFYPTRIRNVALIAVAIFAAAYLLKDTKIGKLNREYAEFRAKRGFLP
jgi:hypothetical protein